MDKDSGDMPFVVVSRDYDVDKRNQDLKNRFTRDFMEAGRGIREDAEKAWNDVSKAKLRLDELLEGQKKRIIDFGEIENCLRTIYTNQPIPPSEEALQKTIDGYRENWERDQHNFKSMLKRQSFNPEEDFRKRVLDPKTRDTALKEYLIDSAHKDHFRIQALKILFELNDEGR